MALDRVCTLNPQSFNPGHDYGGSENWVADAGSRPRSTLGFAVPSRPDQSLLLSPTPPSSRAPAPCPGPPDGGGPGSPTDRARGKDRGSRLAGAGGRSYWTGPGQAAPATDQMAADGARCARHHSPSSWKPIQWPAVPLLCARVAQQPHNSPRQRNPQKLRQAFGTREEGDGPLPPLYGSLSQSRRS